MRKGGWEMISTRFWATDGVEGSLRVLKKLDICFIVDRLSKFGYISYR